MLLIQQVVLINSVKDTVNKSFRYLPEKELSWWKIHWSVGSTSHHKNIKNQLLRLRTADFFCLKKAHYSRLLFLFLMLSSCRSAFGRVILKSFILFSTAELYGYPLCYGLYSNLLKNLLKIECLWSQRVASISIWCCCSCNECHAVFLSNNF